MFKFLVDQGTSMRDLSMLHPEVLEGLMELGWANRMNDTAVPNTGHPRRRSDVPGRFNPGLPVPAVLQGTRPRILPATGTIPLQTLAESVANFSATTSETVRGLIGHHAIYAYMIENTRIVEVFRRVLDNYLHGER